MNLTYRQADVLESLRSTKVQGSGTDGSVLETMRKKGLVIKHYNSAPGYVYYTWTLTELGKNGVHSAPTGRLRS